MNSPKLPIAGKLLSSIDQLEHVRAGEVRSRKTKFPFYKSLSQQVSHQRSKCVSLLFPSHSSGTKMDQEPHGQCGQTSEPQPEVHWPFWGAPPSRGTRL